MFHYDCILEQRKRKLHNILTGTFFCVATTAVSTPFTATEVRPGWLIALKAYSIHRKYAISSFASEAGFMRTVTIQLLTDLVQSPFRRKNRDQSVESSATSSGHDFRLVANVRL